MSSRKPPFWVVLRAHAKADPRKTGLLIALALVMVVVYVKMFWKKSGPSETMAVTTSVSVLQQTPKDEVLGASSPVAASFSRESLDRPLFKKLERDPFAMELSQFQGEAESEPQSESSVVHSDDPMQSIRELASELKLGGVICGKKPMAWINGRVLEPGNEIAGFMLDKVEEHRVILRRDGVAVALYGN